MMVTIYLRKLTATNDVFLNDPTKAAVIVVPTYPQPGGGPAWRREELYYEQELRAILEDDDEILIICEAILAERAA